MRTKYYTIHPRGFANEYTAVKATTPEEDKALDEFYENTSEECMMLHVTAKQLKKMISAEKWKRKHDGAFSGYCNLEPITVTEFLREREW